MEKSLKITVFLFILFCSHSVFSQSEKSFCKAIKHSNFRKVERIVHKLARKNSKGETFFNGPGSGYQTTLVPCLDSITGWILKQPCVEDAYWDKCQVKISIYPGWSSIGVKFKTSERIIEKCFMFQEGTTGQVNFFGWRPRIFKYKAKLIYKKMYDCDGFIETQKLNCVPQITD